MPPNVTVRRIVIEISKNIIKSCSTPYRDARDEYFYECYMMIMSDRAYRFSYTECIPCNFCFLPEIFISSVLISKS